MFFPRAWPTQGGGVQGFTAGRKGPESVGAVKGRVEDTGKREVSAEGWRGWAREPELKGKAGMDSGGSCRRLSEGLASGL